QQQSPSFLLLLILKKHRTLVPKKEMEVKKRAAAIAALCIMFLLVLPSGQRQQVAAMSDFCRCFNDCYPGCRSPGVPRWLCIPFCANKCSPNTNQAGDGIGSAAATCRMACKIHICDFPEAPADAADADVCMQNCNKMKIWSHKAHN
uniref:Uncharacterized protein n=3 Tax=Aegilops tauschii TaxID=37682 RepID=A0A453MXR0_AEGTS